MVCMAHFMLSHEFKTIQDQLLKEREDHINQLGQKDTSYSLGVEVSLYWLNNELSPKNLEPIAPRHREC